MFVSKKEIIIAAEFQRQEEDVRSADFTLRRLGVKVPEELEVIAKNARAFNEMLVARAVELIPEEFLRGKSYERINGIFATNVSGRASINLELRFYVGREKVALLIDNETSKLYRSWTCNEAGIVSELNKLGIVKSNEDFWVNENDYGTE